MVGLYDVDGKIPNLALMKISTACKSLGEGVEWYIKEQHSKYSTIYASKIFTFSSGNITDDMIIGGSGISLTERLPDVIDNQFPDYSLYPFLDYSVGQLTRGCPRGCPFCIVSKKDGNVSKHIAELHNFHRPSHDKIMLLDSNILANEHNIAHLHALISCKKKICFSQGVDARLITDEIALLLSKIKIWKQITIAWDMEKDEQDILCGISVLLKYVKPYKIQCFVLIGFNTTEEYDLYRIRKLREYKIDPYIMSFKRESDSKEKTRYMNKLERWINSRRLRNVTWEQYNK